MLVGGAEEARPCFNLGSDVCESVCVCVPASVLVCVCLRVSGIKGGRGIAAVPPAAPRGKNEKKMDSKSEGSSVCVLVGGEGMGGVPPLTFTTFCFTFCCSVVPNRL